MSSESPAERPATCTQKPTIAISPPRSRNASSRQVSRRKGGGESGSQGQRRPAGAPHPAASGRSSLWKTGAARAGPERGPSAGRAGRVRPIVAQEGERAQMAVREAEPVETLQEVKEAGLDREDLLGMYRNMLITRAIEERGHILYKQGKIPGSFYTGRGNEASAVGVATAMGAERRRDAAAARHGRPRHARDRAVAGLRAVHGPCRRPDGAAATGTSTWATPGSGCYTMVSHLPGDAPRRRRHGARVQDPRGEARRDRLVRRGRVRARRRARGHEPRGRPPAAGRVRDRQQPVGVLDARPPRVRGRPPRRPGGRATASTASSSTAPTCSPCTARRSARSRRPARAAARR